MDTYNISSQEFNCDIIASLRAAFVQHAEKVETDRNNIHIIGSLCRCLGVVGAGRGRAPAGESFQ